MLAEASRFPLELNARDQMIPPCAAMARSLIPVSALQIQITPDRSVVKSQAASRLPSGLNATATELLMLAIFLSSWRVATSQIDTPSYMLAVAILRASGLNATPKTG